MWGSRDVCLVGEAGRCLCCGWRERSFEHNADRYRHRHRGRESMAGAAGVTSRRGRARPWSQRQAEGRCSDRGRSCQCIGSGRCREVTFSAELACFWLQSLACSAPFCACASHTHRQPQLQAHGDSTSTRGRVAAGACNTLVETLRTTFPSGCTQLATLTFPRTAHKSKAAPPPTPRALYSIAALHCTSKENPSG